MTLKYISLVLFISLLVLKLKLSPFIIKEGFRWEQKEQQMGIPEKMSSGT